MSYGFQIKKQQSGTPGIFWQRENEKKTDRKFGYKSRDQRFRIRKDPQEEEEQYRNVLGPRIDDEEEKRPPKPQKDFIKKNREVIGGKNKGIKKPTAEKTVGTKGADPKSVTITQDQLNSILASMTKIASGKEDNLRISIDGKKNEILIDSPRRNQSDDERDHDDDYRYDTDDEKRHKQRNKKQTESKPKRKNKKEEDVSIFDLLNTSRTTKENSRNNDERKEAKKKSHDDSDYDDKRSVDYDHKRSRDRDQKRSRDKQKSKDRDRDYSEDRSYRHRSRDHRSRERSGDRRYSRERSRGHHRDRRDSGDRDYHRSKSRDRDSSYDRHRSRYRSHSREDRHRDRYRSHSRDRDDRHRSRDRHRSKSRDRDGSGDRDRPRQKRREKEKDRDKDEDTSKLTVENQDGDGEKKLTPRDVAGIPLALPWKHMTKAEQMRLLAARNKLQADEEKAEEKALKEKKRESKRIDSSRRTSRKKNRSRDRESSEISGYGDRNSDNDDRYNRKEDKKKSNGLPPAVPKGPLTLAEKKKEQWARERAESKIAEVTYTPWGKPGAGAPIRTDSGKVAADYKSRQVLRYFNLPRM